jgi:hypothetical protein
MKKRTRLLYDSIRRVMVLHSFNPPQKDSSIPTSEVVDMGVNYHALDARMENVQSFLPCLREATAARPRTTTSAAKSASRTPYYITASYYQNSKSVREMLLVLPGHCCLTSLAENPPSKDIFEAIQNLPSDADGSTMTQCPSQIPV